MLKACMNIGLFFVLFITPANADLPFCLPCAECHINICRESLTATDDIFCEGRISEADRRLYTFSGTNYGDRGPYSLTLGGFQQESTLPYVEGDYVIPFNSSRTSLSEPIRSVDNDTLGYEDAQAQYFTCPVGEALMAMKKNTSITPDLPQLAYEYYCDTLDCVTVEDQCTWIYMNRDADPLGTGNGANLQCSDKSELTAVVTGICINFELNETRCLHEGDAHYLAFKCCQIDRQRDQCYVFHDSVHDPEYMDIDITSPSADDFNVTCQDEEGTKTFITSIVINSTYLDYKCSQDIMNTSIHGFSSHTLTNLSQSFSCPAGKALHQWIYTHDTQTYTFICGFLTDYSQGVPCGEVIPPASLGFVDFYPAFDGSTCGPYLMCGLQFASVDNFLFQCCGTNLVDTTSTTFDPITYTTTTITTTTITTTTRTFVANEDGCNSTLECLPAPTGTWPTFTDCYNVTNFTSQWPCSITCHMPSACVIVEHLTGSMFHNADINELYIIGRAGGADELTGVDNYVFAETRNMTKLRVPPYDGISLPAPEALQNWDDAACSRTLSANQLGFIDETNVTECITTTTTTTTVTTTTKTTTITEPTNCTGVTCPEECSRIYDLRNNTIGYNNIYNYTCSNTLPLGACCTTTFVCARGSCVGAYMFNNMSSLEELVLLASEDTVNYHFDYIGAFALSNLTLRTLHVDPVENGVKNVDARAYIDNNCYKDSAHEQSMRNGAAFSYTCYATTTTTTPTTATNDTTTTTNTTTTVTIPVTTEESGSSSSKKKLSTSEIISVSFGSFIGVMFIVAIVIVVYLTKSSGASIMASTATVDANVKSTSAPLRPTSANRSGFFQRTFWNQSPRYQKLIIDYDDNNTDYDVFVRRIDD